MSNITSNDIYPNLRHTIIEYSGICGLGKTFTKLSEFKTNPELRGIFFTENKDQSDAVESDIKKIIPEIDRITWQSIQNFVYVYGERKYIGKCLKYHTDPDIKHLINNGVSASNICQLCQYKDKKNDIDPTTRETCPYVAQFKERPRIIICDIHYINTAYISDIAGYELILDDSCTKKIDIASKQKFFEFFSKLNEFRNKERPNEIDYTLNYFTIFVNDCLKKPKTIEHKLRALNSELVDIFIFYIEKSEPIPKEYFVNLSGLRDWIDTWQMSYKDETWKVSALKKVKDLCLERDTENTIQLSKNFTKQFENPNYRLSKGIETYQISILDAVMPKRFIVNIFPQDYANIIEVLPKDITCQTKIIYRIGKHAMSHYTLGSAKTQTRIVQIITAFAKFIYPDRQLKDISITITTFKGEKLFYLQTLGFIFKKVLVLNYGKVKGINDAIGYDINFLIGTYSIPKEDLLKEFEYEYLRTPETDEHRYDPDLGMVYTDPELNDLNKRLSGYEQYQGFHRSRPYRYKTVICCIGTVPELAQGEFETKQLYAHKVDQGYEITPLADLRTVFFRSLIPNSRNNIIKALGEKFGLKERQAYYLYNEMLEADLDNEFIEVKRDDLRLKPVYIEYTNVYELRQSMLEPEQEALYYG